MAIKEIKMEKKIIEIWTNQQRCIYITVNANIEDVEKSFDEILCRDDGCAGLFKLTDIYGVKYSFPVRSILYYLIRDIE